VLSAPLSAIVFSDNEFHEELPCLFPSAPNAKDVYFAERAVREQSATFNAALQMAYLIVGIRAAGLAAGPMIGFEFDGVAEEFGDPTRSVHVVINIGNPAENASTRAARLDYGDVFTAV
jgi:3-hydroxypropanoate dehydrogenase